jgi:predicted ATP-grasp superfamily ATP-dependent carboligase
LTETGAQSLLVLGVDVVALATSAKKAGYQVYAVDYFGDQDLTCVCKKNYSILKQRPGKTCGQVTRDFKPVSFLKLTRKLLKRRSIDGVLLSSGLDDSTDVLSEIDDLVPILGNSVRVISNVRDKMGFFQQLKRLNIACPRTGLARDFQEVRRQSKDIGYPILIKPTEGFGGAGIRKARNFQELKTVYKHFNTFDNNVLVQEFIPGTPASISFMSCGGRAVALSLNEQLLGIRELGQTEPFGYCGNIVPLKTDRVIMNKCMAIVENLALHFNLVGSNGVDLVISREGIPYVIEVNPRFQGTLECIEQVFGINMVDAHAKACLRGILPQIKQKTVTFCTRLILYAHQRLIAPNLNGFQQVRDIPLPKVIIEKGEPICSIIVEGASRRAAFNEAKKITRLIYGLINPKMDNK